MLDCGIHPGFSGMNALPFFDEIDLDTVDVMLVTHFHLDHCAAVPYVVGKTNFKVLPRPLEKPRAASSVLHWRSRLRSACICLSPAFLQLICETVSRQQQQLLMMCTRGVYVLMSGAVVLDPWYLHDLGY